jgi:hypothetical protein
MKLNNLQLGVLRFLRDDGPRSSYGLGAGLNTLNALASKKLVKADRSRAGSFSTPRTSIKWEITDEGRQCVAHLDKDGLSITNGDHK